MSDASSGWLSDVAEELRLLEQDELCYGIQAASDPREEVDEPDANDGHPSVPDADPELSALMPARYARLREEWLKEYPWIREFKLCPEASGIGCVYRMDSNLLPNPKLQTIGGKAKCKSPWVTGTKTKDLQVGSFAQHQASDQHISAVQKATGVAIAAEKVSDRALDEASKLFGKSGYKEKSKRK